MSIMLNKNPLIIAFFLQKFRSFLPGFIAVSRPQFAETQTVAPIIQPFAFIFDEYILEMNGRNTVKIFVNRPRHIAICPVMMTDVKKKIYCCRCQTGIEGCFAQSSGQPRGKSGGTGYFYEGSS